MLPKENLKKIDKIVLCCAGQKSTNLIKSVVQKLLHSNAVQAICRFIRHVICKRCISTESSEFCLRKQIKIRSSTEYVDFVLPAAPFDGVKGDFYVIST